MFIRKKLKYGDYRCSFKINCHSCCTQLLLVSLEIHHIDLLHETLTIENLGSVHHKTFHFVQINNHLFNILALTTTLFMG